MHGTHVAGDCARESRTNHGVRGRWKVEDKRWRAWLQWMAGVGALGSPSVASGTPSRRAADSTTPRQACSRAHKSHAESAPTNARTKVSAEPDCQFHEARVRCACSGACECGSKVSRRRVAQSFAWVGYECVCSVPLVAPLVRAAMSSSCDVGMWVKLYGGERSGFAPPGAVSFFAGPQALPG